MPVTRILTVNASLHCPYCNAVVASQSFNLPDAGQLIDPTTLMAAHQCGVGDSENGPGPYQLEASIPSDTSAPKESDPVFLLTKAPKS